MKKRGKFNLIIKHLKLLLIGLFVFFLTGVNANPGNEGNTGSISGVVKDKKTGETLVGANVFIDGTFTGTVTDFDGHFELSGLKPGQYDLKVSFVSYTPIVYEKIKVEPIKVTYLNVELEETAVNLQGVTITEVRRTNTEMSMISSIKAAPLVVNGISNQQIQRSQDRDASEVVKRLPGVTVMEDRFIIVRGLNQRYNNVWLNNAATPSSETDVKAFSFDVIPSGMIDNIMIYKSGAPELPGDFVGGFIKVTTKNMPDKNSASVELGTSINSETTFNNFYYYKGGKTDFLGFDDGTRALPSEFPSNLNDVNDPATLDKLGKQMPNNWAVYNKKAIPDIKATINFSRRIKLGNVLVGNINSVTYGNSYEKYDNVNNAYGSYISLTDQPYTKFTLNDSPYKNSAKWSILHNWAFYLGNGHKIEFRNLFNQIGYTKTTIREGYDDYYTAKVKSYGEMFLSRSMYSGQLGGEHSFNDRSFVINWDLGYAFANRLEPDRKMYLAKFDETADAYRAFLPSAANPKSCGHLYLENNENIYSAGINIEKKIGVTKKASTIKTGFYSEIKDRAFDARNIGFIQGINFIDNPNAEDLLYLPMDQLFAAENIDYYNKIKLAEYTNKSDSYSANNKLFAGYVGVNVPLTSKINIYGGVRAEKNKMTLNSYEAGYAKPVNIDIDKLNLFPSANVSYNFTNKLLVRVAYYESVNRPEFREIAPFVYYDYNENASITGNTALQNANIKNIDFRFEAYPSEGEFISVALFYKDFKNPIEMVYNETGSGLAYTFKNAQSAENKGIEIELKKSLDFIGFNNFSMGFNCSFIDSKVFFQKDSITVKQVKDRPLQGQSPYVVNTGLYYDNNRYGLKLSALYNVVGERIQIVGKLGSSASDEIPDIYEMPRHLLDLTFSKTFGKSFELKGGVKNLLNQAVKYRQTFKYEGTDGTVADRVVNDKFYMPGRIYSLSVVYKF